MRLACPQERLDCSAHRAVKLNLNCRDEIIPILRALQQVYAERRVAARTACTWWGRMSTRDHEPQVGARPQLLGSHGAGGGRLGLQFGLRQAAGFGGKSSEPAAIMGIGDWQAEEVDFDWRRIEDNVLKLRPETLKKINDLIVRLGHELKPKAIEVGAWRYLRGGNQHSLSHGIER